MRSTGAPSRTAGPSAAASASGRRLLPPAMLGAGLVVHVGDAAEVARGDQVGAVGARDLHAGQQRLARARRDVEPARKRRAVRSGAPPSSARPPAATAVFELVGVTPAPPRGSRRP